MNYQIPKEEMVDLEVPGRRNMDLNDKMLYTVKEASATLGVNVHVVYSLIKKGLIEISGKKYMLTAKMYQAVKSDIEYMQDKVLQYVKAKGLIMEYMVVL